jgi:lysozyme
MSRLTTSARGLAMIKRFEGFAPNALALPDGQWLVGHGHLRMTAPPAAVTEEEAHGDLLLDLVPYEDLIHQRVQAPLSQSQFDALASFAFSIGLAAFERSDVLRRVNAGDVMAAAAAMEAWRKTRLFGEAVVLDALVLRRAQERALFLESQSLQAAPSVLVHAQLDHAAAILGAPHKTMAMVDMEQAITAAVTPPEAPPLETVADPVAMRIANILAAEPTTASALTRSLKAEQSPEHDEAERVDDEPANLMPESEPTVPEVETRPLAVEPPPVVAATKVPAPPAKTKWFGAAMDSVALIGLLAMGLGLLALAGLAISYGSANGGGFLTAAVLGGPGVLAVAMALFYLIKGTARPES